MKKRLIALLTVFGLFSVISLNIFAAPPEETFLSGHEECNHSEHMNIVGEEDQLLLFDEEATALAAQDSLAENETIEPLIETEEIVAAAAHTHNFYYFVRCNALDIGWNGHEFWHTYRCSCSATMSFNEGYSDWTWTSAHLSHTNRNHYI